MQRKIHIAGKAKETLIQAVLSRPYEANVWEAKIECAHWHGQTRFEPSMCRVAWLGLAELISVSLRFLLRGKAVLVRVRIAFNGFAINGIRFWNAGFFA